MTSFVTGGTGFIGSHVVQLLVQRGEGVRVLVRPTSQVSRLKELGVELAFGDVTDPMSLPPLLAGCDRVYHLAAILGPWAGDVKRQYRANVEGTHNVLKAAEEAGTQRVVHTSSIAALGVIDGGVGTEATVPTGRFQSHYGRTKFEAERVVKEFVARGLDVVMVNPSVVFGPWDRGFGRFISLFLRRRLPALPYPDSPIGVVYVSDVALGHLLAMEKGQTGERYILSADNLSLKEMTTLLSQFSGVPPPSRAIPGWLMKAVALSSEGLSKVARIAPPVPLWSVRALERGSRYDGSRAVRELGLTYTPLEEAVAKTVAWHLERMKKPASQRA